MSKEWYVNLTGPMCLHLLIGCGRRRCVSGSDPRPDCSRTKDDTVINHELPSWAKIVSVKSLHILCVAGELHLLCSRVSRYISQWKKQNTTSDYLCNLTKIFSGPDVFVPPAFFPSSLPSLFLSCFSETSYTFWINGEVLVADREVLRWCVFCSHGNWFWWVSGFLIHHRYAV